MEVNKLPMEWVDRIFLRLLCIYKEKWTNLFGDPKKESLYKSMWSTGLSGLPAKEIRRALDVCEAFPHADAPTHIQFYHYAKGIRVLSAQPSQHLEKGDPAIARKHLDEIKSKLKKEGKVSHGT